MVFTQQALKDYEKIKAAGYGATVRALAEVLAQNPYQIPPPYEKLTGNLKGKYSRRINIQHRMVYSIDTDTRTVHILRLWTHYER